MRMKQRGKYDTNFDILIEKFESQIYGTQKGAWRLKLLKEDLAFLYDGTPLKIWDAGCGFGQLALWFATKGHHLTCCDISYKMLQRARESFADAGVHALFYQKPFQQIAKELALQDLILFHAVIEWLANPKEALDTLDQRLQKGGYLSLLFFNQNSFIYGNVLKGGWRYDFLLDESKWWGKGKKLTPPYPQKLSVMCEWFEGHGYEIVQMTGIRVFHDMIEKEILQQSSQEKLFELEYKYARDREFMGTARYIHILAKKP